MPKKRAPAVPAVAETPTEPMPDTKEGLLEALGKLCDEVDEQLAKELIQGRRPERNFRSPWAQKTPPWPGFMDQRDALTRALANMLGENEDFGDYVREHLGRPGGEVPSFARPGFFVVWIDFVPLGCCWEGFINPKAMVWAIDSNKPWINEAGQKWLNDTVGTQDASVEQLFRTEIAGWTTQIDYARKGKQRDVRIPAFQLLNLTPPARKQAEKMLEDMPWLKPILERGPVNPIPMPSHIKSVQMALA
jgi:hypothetical protein